jgi:hypothetical protein
VNIRFVRSSSVYRVRYGARLWHNGETPKLVGEILEGDPKFSV